MHCELQSSANSPSPPFVAAVVTLFSWWFSCCWNKTPHLHRPKSGSSGKKTENILRKQNKKTSEGMPCSSITDRTAWFWLLLTPPRFCNTLHNSEKKQVSDFCSHLIVGGEQEEEEKNKLVQRCRLEVLIIYQTRYLLSPYFPPRANAFLMLIQ